MSLCTVESDGDQETTQSAGEVEMSGQVMSGIRVRASCDGMKRRVDTDDGELKDEVEVLSEGCGLLNMKEEVLSGLVPMVKELASVNKSQIRRRVDTDDGEIKEEMEVLSGSCGVLGMKEEVLSGVAPTEKELASVSTSQICRRVDTDDDGDLREETEVVSGVCGVLSVEEVSSSVAPMEKEQSRVSKPQTHRRVDTDDGGELMEETEVLSDGCGVLDMREEVWSGVAPMEKELASVSKPQICRRIDTDDGELKETEVLSGGCCALNMKEEVLRDVAPGASISKSILHRQMETDECQLGFSGLQRTDQEKNSISNDRLNVGVVHGDGKDEKGGKEAEKKTDPSDSVGLEERASNVVEPNKHSFPNARNVIHIRKPAGRMEAGDDLDDEQYTTVAPQKTVRPLDAEICVQIKGRGLITNRVEADAGESNTDTERRLYEEAMSKGYVETSVTKCLILGAAGVGKTHLKHLLLKKDPPGQRVSTRLADNPVRAISFSLAVEGGQEEDDWFVVEDDQALLRVVGGIIRDGGVSMATSLEEVVSSFPKMPIHVSSDGAGAVHPDPTPARVNTTMDTGQQSRTASIEEELIHHINHSSDKKKLFGVKWFHFIDSGGQLQYHDILPLFIQKPAVAIFVLNLSEELSHQPTIEYYGADGKPVSRPYRSSLSHKQILQHCLGAMCSQDARPLIITVGTHRDAADRCSESIEEKSQKLKALLDAGSFRIVYNGEELKEVIFAVNGKTPRDEDRHVAKVLREEIISVCPQAIKMPIAWFGLEVLLQRTSHDGILSLVECQGCAKRLHIEGDAFSAALHHLVHNNVFLHYPELLPQTVFCDPQVVLTKVNELVEYHLKLRDNPDVDEVAVEHLDRFLNHGLLYSELLNKFPKHYREGLFTPRDLLKILVGLNVIAMISDNGEYLMPALLPYLDSDQVSRYCKESTSLIIRPTEGYIASGLFCGLVAYLLSPTNPSSWRVCMDGYKPLCLYRNCITFELQHATGKVTLFDLFSYIQVHVTSSKVCREIRDCVYSSIKSVCRVLNYRNVQFEDAFICVGAGCSSEPPHVAVVTSIGSVYKWRCTVKGDQIGDLRKDQLMWCSEADEQSPLSEEYISAEEDPSILVGVQNKDGRTQLIQMNASHEECGKELLEIGTQVKTQNKGEYFTNAPPVDLLTYTEQKYKNEVEVDKYPLHTAVKEGNIKLIMQLTEKGGDLNEFDNDGRSSLMLACKNGHSEVVRILLSAGVQVNQQDKDGWSSLMLACKNGHSDVVRILLSAGVQINQQDKDGWSSLMLACKNGHSEVVRILLSAGVQVNQQNKSHMNAMDVATRNRYKKAMDLLIIQKQKISTTNELANITNLNRQDPFVDVLSTTFNTSTSLYRGFASKAQASPSYPFPIKASDDSSYISLEQRKKAKQRVKDLQTREHDLRRLQSKQDNGKEKDLKGEKQAQCQKAKNLKRKMELFSNEAKQSSQRLSADNYQLREELRQEVHHHELIRKSIEGEARQLELKMSSASVRMRAVQRVVENKGEMDQKSLKTIPCILNFHLPHLKQIVEYKSLVHVIISGLPSLGKSHILNHLFFNEDIKTQFMNEEFLSVRETILTSDGHSWKWMQVSKTEASALVVGSGISQAYAKEGLSPYFVIPDESSQDIIPRIIKEKSSQLNNFTDIKELSMINVWDIGANKVLSDLLPLLLPRSKCLVVLCVVSLDSDAGDMHSHMHEGKHGQEVLREPYSKLDYLMAPPSIARCSTMVVGTHTGKLPRDRLRARQRTVERLIRANAEEMGIGKTLYPRCIAVDTSNQGDNIVKIRSALEKVAVNNREYSVEVPLIWVCLHGNLVRECKSWYITKETLCHFAKQLGIINQQDVEKWLNLYSECGSIIYFDETILLRNYIILKPGVFFSKVQKLYVGAKEAGHGRVHELAKQLWQKEDSEFLLNIFEHLGLMVRADDISAGSSTGKLMKYYMPSLCPECISSPIAEALSSLFVILPRASLSSTHLAKFVQFTKVLPSLEDIKYVVNEVDQYWNQLHLKLYSGPQLADVNIRIEDNHMEVKVTCALQGTDGDQMLHKACSVFKTVIVDFFQHISKDGLDLQYELSLLCPPSLQSPKPHFISFHPLDKEDVGNRGMLFCGGCKQDIGIEDSALKWLRADYQGPRPAALKQEEVISTDLIIKLSYELSTITLQQMEGLGWALGCTNTDIEMMLRCSSMQECILSLLQIWVRNYHLPTKERLAQALKRSGCLDKAIRLTSSDNYVPSLLSLEERTMISTQVSEFRKQIEIKDSETHCCNKVLGLYSKRTDSSNCLIHALVFTQEFQNFVLLLLLKNNAFWMLK